MLVPDAASEALKLCTNSVAAAVVAAAAPRMSAWPMAHRDRVVWRGCETPFSIAAQIVTQPPPCSRTKRAVKTMTSAVEAMA